MDKQEFIKSIKKALYEESRKYSTAQERNLISLLHQVIAEERERVRGEIKEFRHKYRNLNVSSEFDIAFDNFLSSLQDINNKE